uniref:Secreted protein n=1 Tax=Arundo donax TaxID=35708 RepID=A0A0A9CQN1_ARUDO
MSEMPMMVWIWLVTVWMKASSGSRSSSSYSLVPGSGIRRRLTVGRLGRYPAYGYCPKLTAAWSADAIQMMVVQALASSDTTCIVGHHGASLRSPWPTSRNSFHHACSSASPCSTASVG